MASRSQESAAAYAQKWEIPQAFGSYEALLASEAVDAVYVSLPNHLHAEWTIRALESGKHVLCEKPFALSVAEVDGMIAAAARTGRYLAEAFMYRHHPQTKIVGDWVRSGRLGDITLVNSTFSWPVDNPENIRLSAGHGGGSLWDVGVYPVSFAQYVMGGPPNWVLGDQQVQNGVDMVFTAHMHYAGGGVAQIFSSFANPIQTSAEVVGTHGRLVLNRPFISLDDTRRLLFIDPDGESTEITVPEKMLYLGEVEDMNAAILDGTPNYLTLEETRNHVRTLLALYESAASNQIVHL